MIPVRGHFIGDGSNAETGDLVRLRAKRKADVRDGTRISGLDAGHDPLDMVTIIRGICPNDSYSHRRKLPPPKGRMDSSAAHGTVGKIRIQGETLPAMTENAAKGLDWVRGADLRQVSMTGEAVFRLTCEMWEIKSTASGWRAFIHPAQERLASKRAAEAMTINFRMITMQADQPRIVSRRIKKDYQRQQ